MNKRKLPRVLSPMDLVSANFLRLLWWSEKSNNRRGDNLKVTENVSLWGKHPLASLYPRKMVWILQILIGCLFARPFHGVTLRCKVRGANPQPFEYSSTQQPSTGWAGWKMDYSIDVTSVQVCMLIQAQFIVLLFSHNRLFTWVLPKDKKWKTNDCKRNDAAWRLKMDSFELELWCEEEGF